MISLSDFCKQLFSDSSVIECKVPLKEINENRKQLCVILADDIEEYCRKFGNKLDLIQNGVSLAITKRIGKQQDKKTIYVASFEFENGKIYAINNDNKQTKIELGTAEKIINSNYDLGLVILRELDKMLTN